MTDARVLRLCVQFYPPSQGGRTVLPDLSGGEYRPHLVLNKEVDPDFLGVQFVECADPAEFGIDLRVSVQLLYDGVDYSGLVPDSSFTIREGARAVGEGHVISC
ncbi:hypothetical protein [Hyphomonas sp. ND6WE1B]|uniref:hypothetical protein n=1 Tax=Hyphomonas sp. ND6WE1B TaxID=1848191 RepID=UPI0008076422|nr:hypothetical protein [Hyphomonas sp. ND6WE1B]